ncbi:hypothetical protein PGT21_009993 [Puccinia graminis f. sp. tritici]|uniref:Uncharacterized protein n=1 Tax=Puccinia graminis f. sp. tritici TaxID=56615 RepID=A0A5B0NS58_PUCGR|nr:hypothetical protein PGT21_009993 [Puccinia graminis f. sp. tritici]
MEKWFFHFWAIKVDFSSSVRKPQSKPQETNPKKLMNGGCYQPKSDNREPLRFDPRKQAARRASVKQSPLSTANWLFNSPRTPSTKAIQARPNSQAKVHWLQALRNRWGSQHCTAAVIGIIGPKSHPCSLVPQKMLADNQSKSSPVIPSGINTRKRITSQEGPQRCHSEQPLRSVASASLMLFRAVVEECPLGLSDADLNGHRGDCTLNDGRSERPSSTRGLGAGTLYAGAVPGYRRISAHKPRPVSQAAPGIWESGF